jgi:hypothetical protein
MKTVKPFTRMMLLFIFCMCSYSCIGPVPVDVVIIDNELFFVLEEEHSIDFVLVTEVTARKPTDGKNYAKTMWVLAHDLTTEVKKRKYPRLKQIKYGQKFEEFPRLEGPLPLQRNVEYSVKINMGNKFAIETFIITDDNKVIMPKPKFERQKRRVYSVSADNDGNKTLMLESVPQ